MALMSLCIRSSSPRRRGSVRRGFSALSAPLEYWIVRRSLSSGGHSADPVADDDINASASLHGDPHSAGGPPGKTAKTDLEKPGHIPVICVAILRQYSAGKGNWNRR